MTEPKQNQRLTRGRMVLGFLRGLKRWFAAGMVLAALSSLAEMLRPRIIQFTVDSVLGDEPIALPAVLVQAVGRLGGVEWLRRSLWVPALAVIVCSLLAALLRYCYQMCTIHGGEGFVKAMRDQLFAQIERLSVRWHSEHQTGDIIQRCTSDVEEVKLFVSDHMVSLLSMIITIVMALTFIFRINVRLGLVELLSMPLIIGISYWFHGNIGTTFQKCDENEGRLSTIAQENLTGVRVVRAFGRERSEQKRFAEQNRIVTEEWVKLGTFFTVYFTFMDFLTGLFNMIVLVWGCKMCVDGTFTLGGLLAVISYVVMLIRPIRTMGRVLSELSKTGVSLNRLLEIMAAPPEADVPGAAAAPMDRDIVFEKVSFGYPGQPELLHEVSFTVPAGSTLGILGGTGSGKSTLMHLLARLYPLPAENGRILIGGRDIAEMPAAWVRGQVGYVLQEPYLFSRSIAENIAITADSVEMKQVRAASRAACLEEVADGFPKGFDTFVGERGVTLSGGQKQRTAMARTLLQNTPILIFDDSLSAVDAETDARIRENLKTYMGKATVILISHRITTLMAADNILVLEDGRITAQGTHAALSAKPGLYQTICEIQQGKEAEQLG